MLTDDVTKVKFNRIAISIDWQREVNGLTLYFNTLNWIDPRDKAKEILLKNFETNYAIAQCRAKSHNFGEIFQYQYIIDREANNWPNMNHHVISGFNLYTGQGLLATPLRSKSGEPLGVVLGIAIDREGRLLTETALDFLDENDPHTWAKFEKYLDAVCGRFAFILTLFGETRFYADCVAMIGAVYSKETQRVAASTYLCLDREPIQNALYTEEVITTPTGSYRFLHTQDESVKRLNPNHFIRLNDLSTQRFWPRTEHRFEAGAPEYDQIHREILRLSRNYITAIIREFDASIPLTGGYDSRMLLASAGDAQKNVSQYFTHINTYGNRRDAFAANLMTEAVGVDLEIHDRKKSKIRKKLGLWLGEGYKIGAGTNGPAPVEVINGLNRQVKADSVVIRGHQTNILRAQYVIRKDPKDWVDPYWQIMNMAVVDKKRAMTQEVANRFNASFYEIYGEFQPNALKRSADLLFLEGLIPNALGELFCGLNRAFYLSSFNSRRLVELMLRFDTRERLKMMPTHEFIHRADARLTVVPFNKELPSNLDEHDPDKPTEPTAKRLTRIARNIKPSKTDTISSE